MTPFEIACVLIAACIPVIWLDRPKPTVRRVTDWDGSYRREHARQQQWQQEEEK